MVRAQSCARFLLVGEIFFRWVCQHKVRKVLSLMNNESGKVLRKGDRMVVATHNPGKVAEIAHLLAPHGLEAVSAGDLGISEPPETGSTFAENACQKAVHSASASGLPALADDSGLVVDALDGAPGIYSARWGGESKDFVAAMERVNRELEERGALTPVQRSANFTCALALAWPDGECEIFEGKVFGHIVWPPRGENGFGYDPFFVPAGHAITFGEMVPAGKHEMSHRANAFKLFAQKALRHYGR
jgi:XTP/dITP diphosphohydrolase